MVAVHETIGVGFFHFLQVGNSCVVNLQTHKSISFDPLLFYECYHGAWFGELMQQKVHISYLLDVVFALQVDFGLRNYYHIVISDLP
jgi:hypothetical protein